MDYQQQMWANSQVAPTPTEDPNAAYYNQLTPEQYQQWQIYQQQYAAWHAQYGEEYAKQMQMQGTPYMYQGPTGVQNPVQPPLPQSQPPLPTITAPPPPLPKEPPKDQSGYLAAVAAPVAYAQPPPPMHYPPQPYQQPPVPYQSWPQTPNIQQYANAPVHTPVPDTKPWIPGAQTQNTPEDTKPWIANRGSWNPDSNKNHRNNNNWNTNNSASNNSLANKQNNKNAQPKNRWNEQNKNGSNNWNVQNDRPNNEKCQKNTDPSQPTDEEKYFDEQFKKWEEEFECWKKQNANHPDRKAYAEYEKKFEECRVKLLERRELMRKKKLERLGIANIEVKQEITTTQDVDPQPNDPFASCNAESQQNSSDSSTDNNATKTINAESIFKSSVDTIPGLGFDDLTEIKKEPEVVEISGSPVKQEFPVEKIHGTTPKKLLDLSKDIEKAPNTTDLAKQIYALLENPQVFALLTLVNLTSAKPNSIQVNALKPITEALVQLTGKNQDEIMHALHKATEKGLNNREPTPPPANVIVAASGITVVAPPQEEQRMPCSTLPAPSSWDLTQKNTTPWNPWPNQPQTSWNMPPANNWNMLNTPVQPPPSNVAAPLATQQYPIQNSWSSSGSDYHNTSQTYNVPPPILPPPKDMTPSRNSLPARFDQPPPLGNDDFFRPTTVIDYSNMSKKIPPSKSTNFNPINIVDYGHGGHDSNDRWSQRENESDFFQAAKTIDYGHSTDTSFGGKENRNNRKNNNDRGYRSDNASERSNSAERNYYGESNPSYPGKWVLISERPPLIKRTKRGKRKNRKGQIIESKKWHKKNSQDDGNREKINNSKNRHTNDKEWKPAKIIDYNAPQEQQKNVRNTNNGKPLQKNDSRQNVQQQSPKLQAQSKSKPEESPKENQPPIITSTENNQSCSDENTPKQQVGHYGPYPQSTTVKLHKKTISLDEILLDPGRQNRPSQIVIILRGPPGSGKSCLARAIKDQENAISGVTPRILSIDDYYTIEDEEEEIDPVTNKKKTIIKSIYEYEAGKEDQYMQYLLRSFRKNITDRLFDFIIVDAWNDNLKHYNEFHSFAIKNGYTPYTIELLYCLDACLEHNVHQRSTADVRNMIINWKPLPEHHILLDATNLIAFSLIESANNNNAGAPPVESTAEEPQPEKPAEQAEGCIDTPMESIEVDLAADNDDSNDPDVQEIGFFKSKWEDDATEDKLARLDGVSKPLRHQTIEDYLQMDGWEPPRTSKTGKKRVRWADLEAKREQQKMKAIGFVVGHTDWNRMMDPTEGDSALCDIKYIEKAPKFRRME